VDYVAPATLDEAYQALEPPDAHCLAGGQSLVAMMNLGLATPGRLVSLRRIPELRGVTTDPDGGLRIGAMTTHAELARLDVAAAGPSLIAQTARLIAYPAIRTRGTIGGSVALNDPSADYPVALVAAEAVIELASSTGTRRVTAADFFRGLFDTALSPGEIVAAIHVPAGPKNGGAAYEKLSLVAGDFAILSVAAIAGERVELAVGGCAMKPLRLAAVDPTDEALLVAGRRLAAEIDPPSDHRASAAYRRRVAPELIRRAGVAAMAKRLA
jgi:aerobic carbon-monoxide dehydrogenase medium subunit